MKYLNRTSFELDKGSPRTAGELNYCLTKQILQYLKDKGESYQTYNDVLGVLNAVPHELYRRKISKYEDVAIERNGDIY